MSEEDRIIEITSDKRLRCPHPGCPVSISLTNLGIKMALAQKMKCREHGELLVVEDL